MEFPDVGKRCTWPTCKILDFLPLTCSYCEQIFCKDHFNQDIHECKHFKKISQQGEMKSFVCSSEECFTCSPVELLCPKCQKHFCLVHRYHDCFDTVENIENKKLMWNKPKEQFAQFLHQVNDMINQELKKASQNKKKQATALKIQLMRLKGKAEGASSVPSCDRIYFLILLPKGSKKSSKAVFISKDWSVGKVLDSVSDLCGVVNKNNEMNAPKLRLFKVTDGSQVSSETSVEIKDLISWGVLTNGESLILEYVNQDKDLSTYKLTDFDEYKE